MLTSLKGNSFHIKNISTRRVGLTNYMPAILLDGYSWVRPAYNVLIAIPTPWPRLCSKLERTRAQAAGEQR
ncbi:hypothetical protein BH18ACT9_BH18ACT9_21270 [soil metagenome]